uniref:ARAD1B18370p n=1 Tax=Blastobotrys adeninivorans TaxID=409370 RepID=A0A060TCT7_BLAAD
MHVFVQGPVGANVNFVSDATSADVVCSQVFDRLSPVVENHCAVTLIGGAPVTDGAVYQCQKDGYMLLRLNPRLCGGKGGFGTMLKAQGSRMRRKRSGRNENENDSWRTLDGRRVRSIRQAKELASYLETAPESQKKALEKKKAKLQSVIEAAEKYGEGRTRFADTEFLEESEELIKDVRASVAQAMDSVDKEEEANSEANSDFSESGTHSPPTSEASAESSKSATEAKATKPKAMGFFESDDSDEDDDDE